MNRETLDVQAGFGKGRGTRDLIANIHWIIGKAREFQKNIYSASLNMLKTLTVWITANCGKFFKRWEYQTTLPDSSDLYAGQEVTTKNGHGTMDWLKIRKGVCQGCILSPCLFNLYAEYIMRNTGLDEAQAGIKIAWRNINNLIYADDTILMTPKDPLDEGERGE